jgi:hypothetical protein
VFAFSLAAKLGRVDVDGMLSEISWDQFREWQAYYSLDPWGKERADLRIGMLACAIESMWSANPQLEPGDFLLTGRESREPAAEDWRLQQARMEVLAAQHEAQQLWWG